MSKTMTIPMEKAYDIVRSPVITEKATMGSEHNQVTFRVPLDATKGEIKAAVEQVFNVKVTSVNTVNRPGKRKRTRIGFGRRNSTKRAIVSLASGDRIDLFGGTV